jgi:hypothetical protein
MKVKHKWIDGYKGSYSIGTDGGVLSHSRIDKSGRAIRSRMLRTSDHKHGYPQVVLTNQQGKRKNHLVHVLVATAHIPNPTNLPIVKHVDHNPRNKHACNLMWDTQQQNTEDSIAKTYVLQHVTRGEVIVINLSRFCREHNLSESVLRAMVAGKQVNHSGLYSCVIYNK